MHNKAKMKWNEMIFRLLPFFWTSCLIIVSNTLEAACGGIYIYIWGANIVGSNNQYNACQSSMACDYIYVADDNLPDGATWANNSQL